MKFIIQGCREDVESNGGLVLAGKILTGLDLDARLNGIVVEDVAEPKISNADVVRAYFGLLVLGRTSYEDIEAYRHVGYFRRALGIRRVPSAATLRQRLDGARGRFDAAIAMGSLPAEPLTPIRRANPASKRNRIHVRGECAMGSEVIAQCECGKTTTLFSDTGLCRD